MAKISTPTTKIHEKQSKNEENDFNFEKKSSPSNETINALLNFSKSLSISKSGMMNKMFIVTN